MMTPKLLSMAFLILASISCAEPEDSESQLNSNQVASGAGSGYEFEASSPETQVEISLTAGKVYSFSSQINSDSVWTDANESANSDGWVNKDFLYGIFGMMSRLRHLPFYSILGCVQKVSRQNCFKIGSRHTVRAPATGKLILLVNDVIGFYGNNKGRAKVFVQGVDSNTPVAETADSTISEATEATEGCNCVRNGLFGRDECSGIEPQAIQEEQCGGPFQIPLADK